MSKASSAGQLRAACSTTGPRAGRRVIRVLSIALLLMVTSTAGAQPLSIAPPPPEAGIDQRLDAQLPMDLALTDSHGRLVRFGSLFDQRPVLLVFGYYRCPQLCGLLMHGLLESLQQAGVSRSRFRIVCVSIDPSDDAIQAASSRAADLAYARRLAGDTDAPPLDLHLLTGTAPVLHQLAQAAGFRFAETRVADDPAARFAHGAAVVVVTPGGRISRYLMGVQFDAPALRQALDVAGHGQVGDVTDRIALFCAHLDLSLGRYSSAVMWGMRAIAFALVAGLVLLLRRCGRRSQPGDIV